MTEPVNALCRRERGAAIYMMEEESYGTNLMYILLESKVITVIIILIYVYQYMALYIFMISAGSIK